MAAVAGPDGLGASMVASSAGHSPRGDRRRVAHAVRRLARGRPAPRPRRPLHSASARRACSAAAMVASISACRRCAVRDGGAEIGVPPCAQPLDQVPTCPCAVLRDFALQHREPRGSGFRPRRHLRSSRRAASSNSARARPSVHSGCFSRPAGRPARSRVDRSEQRAQQGGWRCVGEGLAGRIVDVDGPARRSSAVTRRARSRSGVTRAAVRCGVSSASRSASAMTSASWCGVAQSARVTCSSAAGSGRCQASVVSAGRISSAINCAARGRRRCPAIRQRRRARSRARASSSRRPNCGWVGSSLAQLASSISRSRPGSTTAPCGRRGDGRQQLARVAGCEPVEPAAITWLAGGRSRQRAAWARIARVRRSSASIWPRAARIRASARRRWRGSGGCAASGWRSCRRPALPACRTARRRSRARRAGRPARGRA